MPTENFFFGAAKETASSLIRYPDKSLLIKSHNPVKALLNDISHQ